MASTTFSASVAPDNGFVLPIYIVSNALSCIGKTGLNAHFFNGASISAFSGGTNCKRSDTGATAPAA